MIAPRAGLALLALQALAFWPVWGWAARRAVDGSDEPWGLAALALAALLLKDERPRPVEVRLLWPAAALTLAYALLQPHLPMLGSASLAALALASTAGVLWLGRPWVPWLGGAALLSLPWIASLQFYLGYPLRAASGEVAAGMLRLAGLPVARAGAGLEWNGQAVFLDAPCSGVQMLWTGALLAVALAAVHRLGTRRTLALAALAGATLVLANGLRSAALFYPEAGLLSLPPWTHSGAGLVVFLLWAAGLAVAAARLGGTPVPGAMPPRGARQGRLALPVFLAACLLAAAAPLRAAPEPPTVEGFPGWPATFEARPLAPLPLTALEERFAAGFPGRLGRFSDGRREVILRWVARPTRKLHPAADCFRGAGYRVGPPRLVRAADGTVWSEFEAEREGSRLRVRERIVEASGRSWTDVGAWYWAAREPCLAWTVAERTD